MQPISTMRSPPAGESPVVSVSKTISRMAPLNTRRQAETSEDIHHLGAGFVHAAGGIDDKVGALPLLLIGHLPGEDLLELFRGHARPGEDPLALRFGTGRDNDDLVKGLITASF